MQISDTSLKPKEVQHILNSTKESYGLLIACSIIGVWAVSLGFLLLYVDVSKLSTGFILAAVLWQMFLYTGLFITAHDAMHRAVFPNHPKINDCVGSLAVTLYGFFSYKKLLKKHCLHHRYPASDRDPDFHDGQHTNPFSWYFHFLKGYGDWQQLVGLTVVFNLMKYVFHFPEANLILFWGLPPILSSIQLFYFGTFLTHREPEGGYHNPHRTQTIPYSIFWSLITCYHFGYHVEHHEFPHVPWWQLPAIYKKRTAISVESSSLKA